MLNKQENTADVGCKALLILLIEKLCDDDIKNLADNIGDQFTVAWLAQLIEQQLIKLNCSREHIHITVRQHLKLLAESGCIVGSRAPDNCIIYEFSARTLELIDELRTDPKQIAEPTRIAARLLAEFKIRDKPYIINSKPPVKSTKKRVGPTRDASASPSSGEIADGKVRFLLQDKASNQQVEVVGDPELVEHMMARFIHGPGASVLAAAPAETRKPVDFRTTLSILLTEQAAAMRATFAKLSQTASENGKIAGLRYIALAMSQWTQVLAGIKYAIACEFIRVTGSKPCNAEDAAAAALSDDVLAGFDAYLQQLTQVAEQLPETSGAIKLPTLHAPNEAGDGFAKVPCSFRESRLVEWLKLGSALPADLLKRAKHQATGAAE